MTIARSHLVAVDATPYYHLISRCVRRSFLCGRDRFSGQSFEHRRQWIVDRIALLTEVFAIDVLAYAVMSNHYHLVIQIVPKRVDRWDDDQVLARWQKIYGLPDVLERVQGGDRNSSEAARQLIEVRRQRLASVSWFMKCLNEWISRRANCEDGCKGAFWESRFKSHALLDEKALLSCMAYVDLNPIRAGLAKSPELSDFTSVQRRMKNGSSIKLAPFTDQPGQDSEVSKIPFPLSDYLTLLDWTGRLVLQGKKEKIPVDLPPILDRLDFDHERWRSALALHKNPGTIIGAAKKLEQMAEQLGCRWIRGARAMAIAFG